MENLECKGSIFRIRNCAFDLLSLGEDLIDVDDDDIWWEFIGKDLRLKSTFLYCDIYHVISYYRDEQKRNLIDLANRLFHYMEELDNALKIRSISLAQICYSDAALVLKEVVASLIPGF